MKTFRSILLVIFLIYFAFGSSLLLTSANALSSSTSSSDDNESSSTRSSKPSTIKALIGSKTSESEDSDESKSSSSGRSVGSVEETLKSSNAALNSYKTAKATEKLAKLKELGGKIIDERISFLTNRLTAKVNNEDNISFEDKATLITLINNQITSLNTLRENLQNITDLTELKVEIKNIYSELRIYSTIAPKIYALLAAYRLEFLSEKLEVILARVEVTKETNRSVLPNYEALDEYLTNANTELEVAKAAIARAITKFNSMIPSKDISGPKEFQNLGREDLAKAKQSLNKVKGYLKQIAVHIDKREDSESSESKVSKSSSRTVSSRTSSSD